MLMGSASAGCFIGTLSKKNEQLQTIKDAESEIIQDLFWGGDHNILVIIYCVTYTVNIKTKKV